MPSTPNCARCSIFLISRGISRNEDSNNVRQPTSSNAFAIPVSSLPPVGESTRGMTMPITPLFFAFSRRAKAFEENPVAAIAFWMRSAFSSLT